MPIILDSLVEPPGGSLIEATSSDGIIYSKYDSVWAGTFIKVDWPTTPDHTIVIRVDYDGIEKIVRGSNMVETVNGIHIGYDHEQRLGETSSWYAVPYTNGFAGVPSQKVTLSIPTPVGGPSDPGLWIKSLEYPDRSMQVMISDWPSESFSQQLDFQDVWSSSAPAGGVGATLGSSGDISVLTETHDDLMDLRTLISTGGMWLLQPGTGFEKTEFYGIYESGSIDNAVSKMSNPARITTFTMRQIARPSTDGQVAVIPGKTFADRYANYELFNMVPNQTFLQGVMP